MFKIILLVGLSIFILTGCAIKSSYKSDFNRNQSLSKDYKISGDLERISDPGFFTTKLYAKVTLYINDKLVVRTALNSDFSGRTELMYDSKLLAMECGQDSAFTQPKCKIFLDGQNLGTLNFNYDFSR